MYPTYYTGTKVFDPLISKTTMCYVSRYVHMVPKQPIISLIQKPYIVGIQTTRTI
jgi:alpha-D-ribose 1-methylphosphonate 5-triphosphate synthase subunit PhnL